MIKVNIQLFAHKKGMGSTRTVVTVSQSVLALSVLTVRRFLQVTSLLSREAHTFIRVLMLASVQMTHCLQRLTAC